MNVVAIDFGECFFKDGTPETPVAADFCEDWRFYFRTSSVLPARVFKVNGLSILHVDMQVIVDKDCVRHA